MAEQLKRAAITSLRRGESISGKGITSSLFRNWLWVMNSSYRSSKQFEIGKEFKALLSGIASGESIDSNQLLPYLCLESKPLRCHINALLADAYYQNGILSHLNQAKIFMQRAWLLSESPNHLLPLYLKICTALRDTQSLRSAYKQLGIIAAAQGDVDKAIEHFNSWHFAYYTQENLDKYEFDFEILRSMQALAAPHRFQHGKATPGNSEKIRLAYLVKGLTELNSILVKINLEFARFHHKDLFDVTFFVPESEDLIGNSPQGKEHIAQFESFGCKVITVPNLGTVGRVLLELAQKIYDSKPHILVTSAALARFEHYFITALRPAPLVIGLVQGPPPQFAPPDLDWSIAWSRHPLIDTPVNCSLVNLKLEWSELNSISPVGTRSLGVPDDACLLLSAGRPTKFQDPEHWRALASTLESHSNAYYVVAGAEAAEIPALASLPEAIRDRVCCLGWREDILNIVAAADIVIDTYPNGGGQVLVQAMTLGLPVLAYRNDYMKLFDQTNWSPVEDFIEDPDIVLPRGDFKTFKQVLSRLINNPEYRAQVGERCRERVSGTSPELGVRECEAIYRKVIELHSASTIQN
ncbi:MAG: glycosyltransferase [Pyrinomonadaceae bacterium]